VDYTTYDGLLEAVREELLRSDVTDAQLKSFIRLAEQRAFRTLRIPAMEVKSALSVVPATEGEADSFASIPVPARWLETITLTDSQGRPIEYISQQYFRKLPRFAAGRLIYFTREANNFLLSPGAPDEEVILYYYEKPEPGDTNANPEPPIYQVLGECLFHGAVSEGWRFFREMEKSEYYKSLSIELLVQLQEQHDQANVSGSTLISKNPYL
jgi:hypothetical protein